METSLLNLQNCKQKNNSNLTDWSAYKPVLIEYDANHKWIQNWFSNMNPFSLWLFDPKTNTTILFKSVENAYQASKCKHVCDWKLFSDVTPSKAKRLGRSIEIREDWESIKFTVMESLLRNRVEYDKVFRERLINTVGMIIEWNNWNDRVWGVSIKDCKGQNMLGRILMKIREELKNDTI